jgi:NADH:ubiquinone oxidoreductase subunit 5 (subunit L)/multisubunit Na+/H+ antiporter MnhA subunit
MSLIYLYTFQYFFLKLNLIILFSSIFFSMIIFYFNKIFFFQNLLKFQSCLKFLKLFLVLTLLISFFFFLVYMYTYILYLSNLNYKFVNNTYLFVPSYNMYFFDISTDVFGLVILFLAYFIGVLSLLALDTRLYFKNVRYLYFVNIFILIVFFFVFSNNILLLFFFYELLLIPSFLLVYHIAPSRRAIQASLYFVI